MKIRYAINARIPIQRAHGLQVMKTCEAMARAGAEVELMIPKRYNAITTDPFAYYAVEPIFTITYLPTLDLVRWGIPYAFALQTLAFTLSLARYLKRQPDDSCLYMRGELGWLLPLVSRVPFIWESHIKGRKSRAEARAIHHAKGIVVVTKRYREDLIKEYGLQADAVLVAPDGVNLEQFASGIKKAEARTRLGLPLDKTLVLYAGSDVPWKGLRYLREASNLLPEDYEVVFVGHMESAGATSNQRFVGARPYGEIPIWLAAADALVLTGDPASDTARYYTSPIKLFEYMAARRPIVATDLPSFRDILSEESAVLVTAGDSQALADGIIHAVNDTGRDTRVEKAWQAVQAYSWQRRAEHILAFIHDRI
ncbi:MAG: glycosyltransferase family 4 protein [bacterium]|nr:glycosyltransferase family 4 protein [bacterium]